MVDVKGRWALITGASRGIGYQAALFMAKQGCNLVLHSRDAKHCDGVLKEVTDFGVQAYVVEAELSDFSAISEMLKKIEDKGTCIDIVLNNAGVQVAYRENYFETPLMDYAVSFQINTMAPMMICYHFLPKMIERGFGRIVNTSSGINLDPHQAGYSASKAALDKVTRDLGYQCEGTDVMINLADPGWCCTDLGGEKAPNKPESAVPGVVVGAFVDDKKSGRWFAAADFYDMTIEEAVAKAESEIPSPY